MIKILIIEDHEDIRTNIKEILVAENFEIVDTNDGEAGIELIQREIPDLIICDVTLPKLNGYQVVSWARANPATEAIPFIFMTGKGSQDDILQARELGANDYLIKPFTRAELLKAITSRLEKRE
ncbi:response regulator [Anabaena azotica]|uniref:Response regulator n=1 Tax=Anabaena azotica FACHB-119 TaxID=947527 RepID=A0ABR8D9W1_9NOST|nr:response regulator [Anabaena azotica]MBD2503909.1 response regulator [Anabaena azotica FACHB-119]